MISIRTSEDRGHFDHGWLNTYHTFSFGDYRDAQHMGFRSLRVINEDRVAPGQGFGTHPHRDMEIISYVLAGGLAHRDSMGHSAVLKPGEVQRITAGAGIAHSEYNASQTEPVHFLQIWLLPDRKGLPPSYAQKDFSERERSGRLRLVTSKSGRDGSISINQDADLYVAALNHDESVKHRFGEGRSGWVQVVRGRMNANGHSLSAGDGAAVSDEPLLELRAEQESEFLLFDLA